WPRQLKGLRVIRENLKRSPSPTLKVVAGMKAMPDKIKVYQVEVASLLQSIYPQPTPIEIEWCAITNIPGLYSPRIDIAVGPFSTTRGGNCINEYNKLMDESWLFIEQLLNYHRQNVKYYSGTAEEQFNRDNIPPSLENLKRFNENARCLLAIEIENEVSRKHLLGGAVNASALGRLGIVIGWTDEKVRALVKLRDYWHFLGSVRKNTFNTANLLIVNPEQFLIAIRTFYTLLSDI
ncbi:MAG: hypothetical protein MN733_41245, partial [Nitrososphaera sp.]|nr:hypothetical protein [Nitrososphaera sp.]